MTTHLRRLSAVFLTGTLILLSGCSNPANDAAATAAVNKWWKESNNWPAPVKAGTVTPAHSITMSVPSLKDGKIGKAYNKVLNIPRHVQTQKEAAADLDNAQFIEHQRSIVQGFTVKGQTIVVLTNLTHSQADIADALELCHNLGSFVWGNGKESGSHFGLENIWIMGADGNLLASRIGFAGKVH